MSAKKTKKTILEPARSFDLAGMVQYGEDSVVSRILIEDAAGTITLFAFDGGQGLSEHTLHSMHWFKWLKVKVSLLLAGNRVRWDRAKLS